MNKLSNKHFISSPLKRLFFLLGVGGFLAGCGAAGGFSLDAPVADLEGGTRFAATFCDTIPEAPEGAQVLITNNDDPAIIPIQSPLETDGSFSLKACIRVGESVNIQILDSDANPISPAQTVVRETDDRTDRCPPQTNSDPVECPPQI